MSDEEARAAGRDAAADPGELAEEREEAAHLRVPCELRRCPVCIRAARRFFDRGAELFLARGVLEDRGLRSPRIEAMLAELAKLAPQMQAIVERFQRELQTA